MPQQDKLYALIKSLTTSEKAYFSRYSRIYSTKEKPDYVRLFEFVDSLEVYEETAILKHFEGEKFIKQLARKKTQLRDKIMESLSIFHADRNVEVSLRRQMNVLPILQGKASQDKILIKEYEQQIKKIKKEAKKHELYGILIELTDWERRLVVLLDNSKTDKAIFALLAERKEFQQRLNIERRLEELNWRAERIIVKDSKIKQHENRQNFEEYIVKELITYNSNTLSTKARRYYYYVQSAYHRYLNNWEIARENAKRLINTYSEKDANDSNIVKQYKAHLCTYLVTSDFAQKREDYLSTIRKIEEISDEDDIKTFNTVYYKLLVYYLNTWNFEAAIETSKQIHEKWDELCHIVPNIRQMAYCYNMLVANWFGDNLQMAIYWLNVLLNTENTNKLQRYPNIARTIQLPLYYDNEDKHLENRIESARKVLSQKDAMNAYRRVIFSAFRKLIRCRDKQEKEDCIRQMQQNLLKIKEEQTISMEDLECVLLWSKLKLGEPTLPNEKIKRIS